MRTVFLSALLTLLTCAPAMAIGAGKAQQTVEVINQTGLSVNVSIEGGISIHSATLEPGTSEVFRLQSSGSFTVEATAEGRNPVSREFTSLGRNRVSRVTITLDSQGNLQLSRPDDPPPGDPPPALSLSRESLLAVLGSGGLLGLAVLGLLINRHE